MPQPRQVKATGKDDEGDITSLKGGFGEVPIKQAIRDIEQGTASYAVGDNDVRVVNGPGGKYLRTSHDFVFAHPTRSATELTRYVMGLPVIC